MAETYRKAKIEQYVSRLAVRRQVLREQLESEDFKEMKQYLMGQIAAIDLITKELFTEFDVSSEREEI